MRVEKILQNKGQHVETISPTATVEEAAQRLRMKGIGALVVTRNGRRIEGILSERDVVAGLARHGQHLVHLNVSEIMTRGVVTCSAEDTLTKIMGVMTNRRIRHIPVVEDGEIAGMVSIGDVVKFRLEDMELESSVLRDAYVARR